MRPGVLLFFVAGLLSEAGQFAWSLTLPGMVGMRRILIQFDTDPHPSTFDRVVAIDADVDQLFSYGGITCDNVESLVHGAMFTRGPQDLKSTAIFIGGSQVAAGEDLLTRVTKTFFGPVRCSVMMDSNGSNTTAAAAVLCAAKHVALAGVKAVVLGGTGPVGQRAAQLLAQAGAHVRVGSRQADKAYKVCNEILETLGKGELTPVAAGSPAEVHAALEGAQLVIAAGAAGVELMSEGSWAGHPTLKVAIDLNAYPPAGIAGVGTMDKANEKHGVIRYGAIGVGGLKMKIHKACVRQLFERNDQILDTTAIYAIGQTLVT